MHDIKAIRDNPDAFTAAMKRRGIEGFDVKSLLSLDERHREALTRLQILQEERNTASKEIGMAMKDGDQARAQRLKDRVSSIKDDMQILEDTARTKQQELHDALSVLPNVLAKDVPDGTSEEDNVEIMRWGTPRIFDFPVKDHVDLGTNHKLDIGNPFFSVDFEAAARISGSRFVTISGKIAKLERALANFFLYTLTEKHGFTEMKVPLLVKSESMYGTGQLPKFSDDAFQTTDGRWLIPTSEVSLTNFFSNTNIITTPDLPLPKRMTALTPCFRSEAGSAGKDTRGMIRQHQFYKVEMVCISKPEESADEHERMTSISESLLMSLNLPYRKLLLCSGDTGFSSTKTYDLEVWIPSQKCYREISSISNCCDFQSRRMNAKFRGLGEKESLRYVHTLNGSALAVGRSLVAIMENYQNADGSITVPEVLQPYMGGITKIAVQEK